jgi:hypothetical protein
MLSSGKTLNFCGGRDTGVRTGSPASVAIFPDLKRSCQVSAQAAALPSSPA